jgi:hypothetical protein
MRSRFAELWAEPWVRRVAMVLPVALALAVALLAFLWPHEQPSPALLRDPLTVKRALSTASALFGDTVTAKVDVLTDDTQIDPESVAIHTDFSPYRAVETTVERRHQGSVSLISTVIRLRCLTTACLPRRDGRPFDFKPLELTYRQGVEDRTEQIPWRALAVGTRLSSDARSPVGISDTPPELSRDFARSPTLLRAVLGALALVVGVLGSLLVIQGLWPRFPYSLRRWRGLSPLEQSLAQVEAASLMEDEALRRRVLDQLANQLGAVDRPELEFETRQLAWTSSAPTSADLDLLVGRVREKNGSGAR